MKLIAATVTVYFVGLVNFQTNVSPITVRLPLATSIEVHKGKMLYPHRADIVIDGLTGGSSTCVTTLNGSWVSGICTVTLLSPTTVALPAPMTPTLNAGAHKLPQLQNKLCGAMTTLNAARTYAAQLTINHGTLESCIFNRAHVSHLTLTDVSQQFTIGANTVQLNPAATVVFRNMPWPCDMSGDEEAHFWWYYKMFNNTTSCADLPVTVASDTCTIPVRIAMRRYGLMDGASGIGCSNSNYP